MWASRYNLFVVWSADRLHPWDSDESAEGVSAVLEIGKAEYEEEVSNVIHIASDSPDITQRCCFTLEQLVRSCSVERMPGKPLSATPCKAILSFSQNVPIACHQATAVSVRKDATALLLN